MKQQSPQTQTTTQAPTPISEPQRKKPQSADREKQNVEAFKRKYFDYYDDIKISIKEDW